MSERNFFADLKRRNVRGAHAPSRAGDGALALANFVSFCLRAPVALDESLFRRGAETGTRGRVRPPQTNKRVARGNMSERNFFEVGTPRCGVRIACGGGLCCAGMAGDVSGAVV